MSDLDRRLGEAADRDLEDLATVLDVEAGLEGILLAAPTPPAPGSADG